VPIPIPELNVISAVTTRRHVVEGTGEFDLQRSCYTATLALQRKKKRPDSCDLNPLSHLLEPSDRHPQTHCKAFHGARQFPNLIASILL